MQHKNTLILYVLDVFFWICSETRKKTSMIKYKKTKWKIYNENTHLLTKSEQQCQFISKCYCLNNKCSKILHFPKQSQENM